MWPIMSPFLFSPLFVLAFKKQESEWTFTHNMELAEV